MDRKQAIIELGRYYEEGIRPSEDAISRKQAIEKAIEAADEWDGGCNVEREKIITNALNELPPVNPQKAGKWIHHGDYDAMECSVCGEGFHYELDAKFCPSCGAKMEEGE